MTDSGLDDAEGGLIVKSERGFAYYLHGQPEPEGEPFVEVNPSIVPGEKWKASFLNWPEAEEAYQEFTRNHPIVIGDEQQKIRLWSLKVSLYQLTQLTICTMGVK